MAALGTTTVTSASRSVEELDLVRPWANKELREVREVVADTVDTEARIGAYGGGRIARQRCSGLQSSMGSWPTILMREAENASRNRTIGSRDDLSMATGWEGVQNRSIWFEIGFGVMLGREISGR